MSEHHVLVVGPFDPDDATDRFEIEHPTGCPQSPHHVGPDGDVLGYDCAVGVYVDDGGIESYFAHADDDDAPNSAYVERVPEGRHPIEHWSVRHPGGPWGPEEWDAGLRTVEGWDQ